MVTVPYYPLQGESLARIIRLQLEKIRRRIAANHRVALEYDDELVAAIGARCTETESGARNVDRILTHSLLPALSAEFLERMARGETFATARVAVADGDFTYEVI
jgi:type VI secretion system protein VasG